ncbi:glycosyltransferase family 39 protein [Williamsia sterculiae]|uniref:4-amino-4-deoxy-L-arabinose transferase n=1 Tax=Williamsia sterculiae TaxID=1344003 RepID=A0A1N7GYM7_9NOCA|nr:glycosyltransferase family 39 protein [Williamsia sterculiae]SIS17689.1 4-amino-4-deoxy-L-arabinose transferase [Williamsia sterculiae]
MTVVASAPVTEDRPYAPTARRRWELFGVATLLVGTAVAYLWNLSANGYANSFYSAAIQAGSVSWKAWFFGSSDAANSITVDKPPMSLWLPGIAVRIFGLNSWSILVPQALMGVASVGLLYVIVRRYFGPIAGLLAGAALALTPVAALMFRFNNPDALLLLLLIAAVWATLKGIEDGRVRWMVLTGLLVGFAFLTKQLQAFLIIPPLAVAYLAFGQRTWPKRLGHLFASLAALVVGAGWWVLAVELWPASSRPWIGGSQHNSILELTFGYNGFGRLTGDETGSVTPGGGGARGGAAAEAFGGTGTGGFGGFGGGGGMPGGGRGGPGGGMWGETGFFRMFESGQGGQIAWLIPTALILGIAAIVLRGRVDRHDPRRAFLVVTGLWLLVTMAVFSYMSGIFHSYYTIALSAPIAALLAGGAWTCWEQRARFWVRCVLAVSALVTGVMAFVLLNRTPDFVPWLRIVVLVGSLLAAVVLLIPRVRTAAMAAALVAVVLGLAGPLAYTADTVSTAKTGSIITAGPAGQGGFGPGGMGGGGRGGRNRGGFGMPGGMGGFAPGGQGGPMQGGQFGGPTGTGQGTAPGQGTVPNAAAGQGANTAERSARGRFGGMGGPGGGLLEGSTPSKEMTTLLETDADRYTWVAAAIGSNSASGYQLATQKPVMPIGGFNGSDPSPTLAQFQQYVAAGKIHYFIAGGMGFGMGAQGTGSSISTWVEQHYTSTTVDGVTLYDLTAPR